MIAMLKRWRGSRRPAAAAEEEMGSAAGSILAGGGAPVRTRGDRFDVVKRRLVDGPPPS